MTSFLSSIASFFNQGARSSKRAQMLSDNEAFSMGNGSPLRTSSTAGLNQGGMFPPDPDSAGSNFSYPPPSPYDQTLQSAGPSRLQNSILPLHNTQLSSSSPLPVRRTWARLRSWLGAEYPELEDTLNYGILPEDLQRLESEFGFQLPLSVRESYLTVDGQEAESAAGCSDGLFFGLTLLPLEDVLEEWRFWREVDEDVSTGANERLKEVMRSIPPSYIRHDYSNKGWIPLVSDKAGNYLGVDLNPGSEGSMGQVIVFGRDFDTKVVLTGGEGQDAWGRWLANFLDDLESGEGFELDSSNDTSEGSDDGVGYESYFFDVNSRSRGEGGGARGAGGMRLSGEYRGWNVLEAFADKSLRHWRSEGVIPEEQDPTTDIAASPQDATLLVNSEELANKLEDIAVDEDRKGKSPLGVPTISVTKPSKMPAPAPMPVYLPTADDISSLPASPPRSPSRRGSSQPFKADLEKGDGVPMQNVAIVKSEKSEHTPHIARQTSMTEATMVPATLIDPSLVDTEASLLQDEIPSSSAESPDNASTSRQPASKDLLVDAEPALPRPVIVETSSPLELPPSSATGLKPDRDLQSLVQSPLEEHMPQDPNQTIRLVGGGGISGNADTTGLPDADDVDKKADVDTLSLNSLTSQESNVTASGSKDKKRGFTANLKRFGGVGGGNPKKKSRDPESVSG